MSWTEIIQHVPRRLFVPSVVWADLGPGPWQKIDKTTDPAQWNKVVSSDIPLVTQFDDGHSEGTGRPTSSASMPTTVIEFLEALDIRDHHNVLEVGTGTGWTAALLSHRVGEQNVTTIEIDQHLAAQAQDSLTRAGFKPRLMVTDGANGYPDAAPYDRIHVTCAVSRVPLPWINQTRPAGVIVLPYSQGFGYGAMLRLDVLPNGAIGRFVASADYMLLRSQRPASNRPGAWVDAGGTVRKSKTRLDPREIRFAPIAADLVIGTLAPGVISRYFDDDTGATLWILDQAGPGGSWATIDYTPNTNEYDVEQAGDRNLWDEIETAYCQWLTWGRPHITRFGMSVTPERQRIWLDSPNNPVEPNSPRAMP